MLKKMILINSANFQFADIDLSKEVFFVGDNASGKTTATRAIHFLYNGNGEKLGIPYSKDTFLKHYFPNDDSYIIYVFETFFIFTYKKNNTIKRWFSKQVFELNNVIKEGKLLSFEAIISYIKRASLKIKPNSIFEYTDILYGKNKKYLDFAIARIDNYKIFLDIFNDIFNVDKAIVTAADIKKAIQKSLDRKDEVLSIDYDNFIRKLNQFSKAYNFFKIFDSSRTTLANALSLKDDLLSLENKSEVTVKAINYRFELETNEFNGLDSSKRELEHKIKQNKNRIKSILEYKEKFENRVKEKIKKADKEIIKLENLKEKFDNIEVEKNIELASEYEKYKKELDDKKYSLRKLQEKISSAQKIIEEQIEQIKYKIKTMLPNEMNEKFFNLSEIEKNICEEDKLIINNDFDEKENSLMEKIEELDTQIEELDSDIDEINSKISLEIKSLQNKNKKIIENERRKVKEEIEKIEELNKKLRDTRREKSDKNIEIQDHENKYTVLRRSNCIELSNSRRQLNNDILKTKAILYPKANSFQEFLSREIEDWEEEIYPIIDKNLLLKSCYELQPVKVEVAEPISFKIDKKGLDTIPTKDEAVEIIKKKKKEKHEILKNSKAIYKYELSKLDETKNRLIADIEFLSKQINNIIDNIVEKEASIKKSEISLLEIEESEKKDIKMIKNKYIEQQKKLISEKKVLITKRNIRKNQDARQLRKDRLDTLQKREKDRDNNIQIIRKQLERELELSVKKAQSEILELQKTIKNKNKDDLIESLKFQIEIFQEKYNNSYDAKKYLKEYESNKDYILTLPIEQKERNILEAILKQREVLVYKIKQRVENSIEAINTNIASISVKLDKYERGLKKYKNVLFPSINKKIETMEYLIDLIDKYEDISRDYRNTKSKFRVLIDKLKKLEKHSIVEINLNNDMFDDVKSIKELGNILESLDELDNFEKNKYDSEKKRRHNNFNSFLRNTIPSKLQSFDDLEMDFEKAKNSINRSLSGADFGVIKNIKLVTNVSKKRNDTIASLLKELDIKVRNTVSLYSNKSLFYYDVPKSIDNINGIQEILKEIKEKGANGMINLFDTVDLSISYTENGRNIENKQNIKDDSSSGGNILLKVAIAMSILNRYAKKTNINTPFFLIIDEISKLQSKNQRLIQEYINNNGFKTLFITPDPSYPDPEKAIYYTFTNIQEEGETLEISQMNII